MSEVIHLTRDRNDIPFGFKLQGGSDFSIPLSVLQVTQNSIADLAGIRAGDVIIKINNNETSWMDHMRAKQEIIRAGNDIALTVIRDAVNLSKPQCTPLSELRSLPIQTSNFTAPPLVKRTNLAVEKEEMVKIGSSHNRAPMGFHKDVGSSITYQSAKATNWEPGDYTKWSNKNQNDVQQNNPTVTAVFHNPYNTPIGLYSDDNVYNAFSHQTKKLIPAESNQYKQKETSSLSMRMLNSALDSTQGTHEQPPSVFDLRGGQNPTGATIPKGFRSVQAPTLPPPEQRHAPVRKEYVAKNVKESWLQPK